MVAPGPRQLPCCRLLQNEVAGSAWLRPRRATAVAKRAYDGGSPTAQPFFLQRLAQLRDTRADVADVHATE